MSSLHLIDLAGDPTLENGAIPLAAFLEGLRVAWRGRKVCATAVAEPAVKRERRRHDPILAVSAEFKAWWDAEPWRTSRELRNEVSVI